MKNGKLGPVRYLFVVGTPGVGKSTFSRVLDGLLTQDGYEVHRGGDYPYLQALFHTDQRQGRTDRFQADPEAEFEVLDPAVYDEALKLLYEERLAQSQAAQQKDVYIVEFSRPVYDTAFSHYPLKILMHSIVVHITAPIRICRLRNDGRRQALENKLRGVRNRQTIFDEDPDLHYVPDAVMSKYYAKDDNEDRKRLAFQECVLSVLPFRCYFQIDNEGNDRKAFLDRVGEMVRRNIMPLIIKPEPFAAYYDRRIECMLKLKGLQYPEDPSMDCQEAPTQYSNDNGAVSPDEFYDVFLAHNNVDKPSVKAVYKALRNRGLRPWLDKEEIPPGRWFTDIIQEAIRQVKAAAVFIGPEGVSRWQAVELRTFIGQCIERKIPVIPVLLPGVEEIPSDLLFLQGLHMVSFQEHVEEAQPLNELQWGITGQRPDMPMA